jgi:multidrug efflux pump subunit AcrA (membrane-fusion protein)
MFKIGMYVKVALATIGGTERTTPLVPESAVQYIGEQTVVFEATDNPLNFIVRRIEVMEKRDKAFPVKKGIFVGDKVVGEGSFLLRAEWLKTNSGV